MVVIGFDNGGWGVSNDAKVETVSTPITEGKKIIKIKRDRFCVLSSPYVVSGVFQGKCKIAMRDTRTNELVCFDGIIEGERIRITSECDSKWLNNI